MSICSLPDPLSATRPGSVLRSQCIEEHVQRVLGDSQPLRIAAERRRESRYAYPYPIHLLPFGSAEDLGEVAPLVVVGKHLSNHGVDFYSAHPISYRRAVVCFAGRGGPDIRLLMDLTWCRFCGHGWYENGGRFLQVME
jgi:hypothetical protein